MEKIARDCRLYRGDRPCDPHKIEGVKCSDCRHYDPVRGQVLVIKLDALGDVLRTTSILPGLRERFPRARLTWITRSNALDFFPGNPLVDRVIPLAPEGLVCLAAECFAFAVNLDTSPLSAGLLSLARAEEKAGFDLDEEGRVRPLGPEAESLLAMSVFDDVKRANRRTYQEMAAGILGISGPVGPPILELGEKDRLAAGEFVARRPLDPARPVVGFNTGGGGRWRHKRWTEKNTAAAIRRCRDQLGAQVILYGGPEEVERNARILAACGPGVRDAGCGNSLRAFFGLLELCDVLVTSDSLALHAAQALGKKVVVLFGPTSAWEIELYGRGERIVAPVDCQCCYLTDCAQRPTCMESIAPETVVEAVERLL